MGKYTKFFVALGAALAVLATALSDGAVSGTEGISVALAFLGALGVYQLPNQPAAK